MKNNDKLTPEQIAYGIFFFIVLSLLLYAASNFEGIEEVGAYALRIQP